MNHYNHQFKLIDSSKHVCTICGITKHTPPLIQLPIDATAVLIDQILYIDEFLSFYSKYKIIPNNESDEEYVFETSVPFKPSNKTRKIYLKQYDNVFIGDPSK